MKFNVIQFNNEMKKAKINSMRNIAFNAAQARFNRLKLVAIEEFESHPVTKELEDESSQNQSGTLNGKGNLFSFIGFSKGEKPTDVVFRALEALISMDKDPVIEEKGDRIFFKYKVKIPTLKTLYDYTPLPFEPGKSWVRGIENGISGFTEYIYWKTNLPNPPSRSGRGLQSDWALRAGSFSPVSYMSKIINEMRTKLSR